MAGRKSEGTKTVFSKQEWNSQKRQRKLTLAMYRKTLSNFQNFLYGTHKERTGDQTICIYKKNRLPDLHAVHKCFKFPNSQAMRPLLMSTFSNPTPVTQTSLFYSMYPRLLRISWCDNLLCLPPKFNGLFIKHVLECKQESCSENALWNLRSDTYAWVSLIHTIKLTAYHYRDQRSPPREWSSWWQWSCCPFLPLSLQRERGSWL